MNLNRIRALIFLLIVGFVLMTSGVQATTAVKSKSLSDADIIERAKALGMVDMKDEIQKDDSKKSKP